MSEQIIDRLRGQLQNCVNHLEHAKRQSYAVKADACIESANKALYETLHENPEPAVPVADLINMRVLYKAENLNTDTLDALIGVYGQGHRPTEPSVPVSRLRKILLLDRDTNMYCFEQKAYDDLIAEYEAKPNDESEILGE